MRSSPGILFAIGAYTLWGLLPVYWKIMETVPAHEILSHRMVWSLPFVLILLMIRRELGHFAHTALRWSLLRTFLGTALLLTLNWYTYIFAVVSGHVVDASLGYFINPLLTVILGVVFLAERPRVWQWISFALATCGVLYLTFVYGVFPWLGLLLAFTFGFYGLIRKTAALDSLQGLTLESAFMFLPALVFLLFLGVGGSGAYGHVGSGVTLALSLTGAVTAIPLLLFAAAVRRTPLTTMGLLQYIAPTLQFLIGMVLYGEPVSRTRLIGFVLIWVALVIFSVEGVLYARRKNRAAGIPPVTASPVG
jgi:chloramphenicol-sensitive protein RarD